MYKTCSALILTMIASGAIWAAGLPKGTVEHHSSHGPGKNQAKQQVADWTKHKDHTAHVTTNADGKITGLHVDHNKNGNVHNNLRPTHKKKGMGAAKVGLLSTPGGYTLTSSSDEVAQGGGVNWYVGFLFQLGGPGGPYYIIWFPASLVAVDLSGLQDVS